MDIRPLSENHIAAFKALRLLAIADAPFAVSPTAQEEAAQTPDEIRRKIAPNAGQIVFGVFTDDQLIAIAGLRRELLRQLAHKATLWGVFVHPEWRAQGLARQLFTHIKQHAESIGVLQLHLSVNAENHRAKALYTSLGFKTYGVEPRCMQVNGRFYDEEHMCLRLE